MRDWACLWSSGTSTIDASTYSVWKENGSDHTLSDLRRRFGDGEEPSIIVFTVGFGRDADEKLLEDLRGPLCDLLRDAACVYTPEVEDVLAGFYPAVADGIGYARKTVPGGYSFAEATSEDKAFGLLSRLQVPAADADSYLLLEPPSEMEHDGKHHLVSPLPVLVVSFEQAFALLRELWGQTNGECIALAERELRWGVVVDTYCGYLQDDFNPAETVYEVAVWPIQDSA